MHPHLHGQALVHKTHTMLLVEGHHHNHHQYQPYYHKTRHERSDKKKDTADYSLRGYVRNFAFWQNKLANLRRCTSQAHFAKKFAKLNFGNQSLKALGHSFPPTEWKLFSVTFSVLTFLFLTPGVGSRETYASKNIVTHHRNIVPIAPLDVLIWQIKMWRCSFSQINDTDVCLMIVCEKSRKKKVRWHWCFSLIRLINNTAVCVCQG